MPGARRSPPDFTNVTLVYDDTSLSYIIADRVMFSIQSEAWGEGVTSRLAITQVRYQTDRVIHREVWGKAGGKSF